MAYAFTFTTKAAYTAAKQSGGSIYNALIPSSSTGGTTNVSRSAVSFIAELGRAVVDSVNPQTRNLRTPTSLGLEYPQTFK